MYRSVLILLLLLPAFIHGQEAKDKPQGIVYSTGLVVPSDLDHRIKLSHAKHGLRLQTLPVVTAERWDCRELGLVPPIKNQANCGSCWDFSGTGACESAFLKAGYGKPDGSFLFSEQYTLDCGNNGGCNGDWPETVLEWSKAKGLPTVAQYGGYFANPRACKSTASMTMYKIADYGYVGSSSAVPPTQAIKDALVKFGPLSVAVAADNALMNSPRGKVFKGSGSRSINHAVMIIGWDDAKSAWLMRNSWGTEWCDDGYQWIAYGANQIGYGAMWATAIPLPPPPPPPPDPPIPPGPGPGPTPNGATITIGKDLKAGTYELVTPGTKAKLDAWEAWMRAMPVGPPATIPPVKDEPPTLKKVSYVEPTSDYDIARDGAERDRRDLVIFCRMPTRFAVDGASLVNDDGYCLVPGVYVALHDGKRLSETHYRFPTDVAGSDVRAWMQAQREVSRPADPFRAFAAAPVICRT